MKANTEVLAVPWAKPGFGCLAVIPLGDFGPQPDMPPLVEAHTGSLADFEFHPFRRDLLATSSVDSPVKLWRLPTGNDLDDMAIGLRGTLRDPWTAFAHDTFVAKRVHHVSFHPLAQDILVAANVEGTMLVWDVTHGGSGPKFSRSTVSQAMSLAWDDHGHMMAVLCKVSAKFLLYSSALFL